jgi:hypothetical protein
VVAQAAAQPGGGSDQGKLVGGGGRQEPVVTMARRRKYGELAWKGDTSRQIVPRTDIGSQGRLGPSSAAGLGRPLTDAELEVWRSSSGAQSAGGQEPDPAELARQRHEAASSAIMRRMRQPWADRETGDA